MKKFTTPCFVRVKDMEERIRMYKWLIDIGYKCIYNGSRDDNIVSCYGNYFGIDYKSHLGCKIDCGTDIDLFKALAAMNDENDQEQWFVRDDVPEWILCAPSIRNLSSLWRKATAEEIIKHFEKK